MKMRQKRPRFRSRYRWNSGGGGAGLENLGTYTAVDPESNFATTTSRLTITDMYTRHVGAYLYKDFGAGYFSDDFEIDFELVVTDPDNGLVLGVPSGKFGVIGVCDTLGCRDDWDAGPWIYWGSGTYGLGTIDLHAGDDSYATSFLPFSATPSTVFYCTLKRVSAVAPLDCSVWLDVYSNAARTTLMAQYDSTPGLEYGRNDIPSATGLLTYRYLEIGLSERLTYDETPYGSYYVQNVEIVSH